VSMARAMRPFATLWPSAPRLEVSCLGESGALVEEALPVGRYSPCWPGRRLTEWVMLGSSQGWSFAVVPGRVVEEPVLARLIASNHRVIGVLGVGRGMLTG
jgi:hypothetical protein